MKRLLTFAIIAVGLSSFGAKLPRNPFWPQGYEGTRHPITLEPRFEPEVKESESQNEDPSVEENEDDTNRATKAIDRAAAEADRRLWAEASKSLRFGSIFCFGSDEWSQASIIINDMAYKVGDLVSTDFNGSRFTWKLESVSSDRKVKLKRLRYQSSRKK